MARPRARLFRYRRAGRRGRRRCRARPRRAARRQSATTCERIVSRARRTRRCAPRPDRTRSSSATRISTPAMSSSGWTERSTSSTGTAPVSRRRSATSCSWVAGWVASGTSRAEPRLLSRAMARSGIDPVALAYYRYERIVEDIAVTCEQVFLGDGRNRAESLDQLAAQWRPRDVIGIATRHTRPDRRAPLA